MKTLEERLEQVEARLARIEQLLPAMPVARGAGVGASAQAAAVAAEPDRWPGRRPPRRRRLARWPTRMTAGPARATR